MEELVQVMEHILSDSERKIWEESEEILLSLYWEIGYHLRKYSLIDVVEVSNFLGEKLGIDSKMFEVAYFFYKENPIKSRAMGCTL